MTALPAWLTALPWLLALALLAWGVSTLKRNVGLVDIFWPLFLLLAALCAFGELPVRTSRAVLVLVLVTIWALRLSIHLARRNWHAPEDHRYQAIRKRNEPGFAWKSLYLVFGLQALLAFVVSAPLQAAILAPSPAPLLTDLLGTALVLGGIAFEGVADAQLAAFTSGGAHRGEVLERGLWRYSRHPNYFGEFCVWWGFFVLAAGTGAWWTLVSPLLMSLLLLRVSGVTLLEKDIGARRPGYAAYVARTNAFFPGPRRSP
jgi:steroid 5-alpha reductase family enzyme